MRPHTGTGRRRRKQVPGPVSRERRPDAPTRSGTCHAAAPHADGRRMSNLIRQLTVRAAEERLAVRRRLSIAHSTPRSNFAEFSNLRPMALALPVKAAGQSAQVGYGCRPQCPPVRRAARILIGLQTPAEPEQRRVPRVTCYKHRPAERFIMHYANTLRCYFTPCTIGKYCDD